MSSKFDVDEFRAFTESVGAVELGHRTCFDLLGEDRAKFLHNFCTADIKSLQTGDVAEAFVLNGKGKFISLIHVAELGNALRVYTVAGQYPVLFEHLDKYIFREDVSFLDRSEATTQIFVAGPDALVGMSSLPGFEPSKKALGIDLNGRAVTCAALDLAGEGWLIDCQNEDVDVLFETLHAAGVMRCNESAFESLRVSKGTPKLAVDVTDANLPQELQRDAIAISFTKGCYLGQETVARIDALGRVNQLLVKFRLESESPASVELMHGDKKQGTLSSVAFDPVREHWIGLGIVRRSHSGAGSRLVTREGVVAIVEE